MCVCAGSLHCPWLFFCGLSSASPHQEETEEEDAESEYQKISQENKISKTMKEQDVKYATQEYKALDKTIAELSSDRDSVSTELAAVMDYDAKIKVPFVPPPPRFRPISGRPLAEAHLRCPSRGDLGGLLPTASPDCPADGIHRLHAISVKSYVCSVAEMRLGALAALISCQKSVAL